MNNALLGNNQKSQIVTNNEVFDILAYKATKSKITEHKLPNNTYVYSNDLYNDIQRILKALESSSNENKIQSTSNTGNVLKPVRKVKISGIKFCKKHSGSCEELRLLNMKIENSIPKITIFYLSFSAFASGIFVVFFMLSILKGINVVHPVMSLLFSIGFIGLFFTAFTSIYDWRKMLHDIK